MKARTIIGFTVVMMVLLLGALAALRWSASPDEHADHLILYCAAGIQAPVQRTIEEYERYYRDVHGRDIRVQVEFGGSGTLLSRLQVAAEGDLFLAGDESFILAARGSGVLHESLELATMKPVIAVSAHHAASITSLEDLLEGDYRIAIGVPDGTAVGRATRSALESIGKWERFLEKVETTKPTVNDLANDVKIGAADAAVVWDVTARQFGLEYVNNEALDEHPARVEIGVLDSTLNAAAALRFARFLASPEHGLKHFRDHHFEVVDGDRWEHTPEVTFFSGGLNRRAMEPIIDAFQKREGVRINTVYQGCGALNAQMAAIRDQNPDQGFPDAYFACDVYYLDPVKDWFEDAATVSSTRIVIVTQADNPHNIRSLEDLAQPGLRVVVGHPTHCTIGGLTERLFHAENLYDQIMRNVVEMQPSSGLMVPPVASGAADASLAYYNDTLPEAERLHVIELDNEYARAIQPFGVASTSHHKHLMLRLYQFMGRAEETFAELGFGWELGRSPDDFELLVPAGARPPRIEQIEQGEPD